MTHVSFETARRLKAAGFPQPAFATGQFWYNQYGEASFVGRRDVLEKTGDETFFCTSVRSGRTEEITPIHDGAIFAPTAEDILRESPSMTLQKYGDKWRAEYHQDETFWHDASGAEACALARLAIREKKA